MMYNELVESYFFSSNHVGTLDLSQPLTAHYRAGEVGRGDLFDLYLRCDEKGRVLRACFKAYGDPYLIAAAEWLCRYLENSMIYEHPCFDYSRIVEELEISKTRYPVALQIEDGYRELVAKVKKQLEGEKNE